MIAEKPQKEATLILTLLVTLLPVGCISIPQETTTMTTSTAKTNLSVTTISTLSELNASTTTSIRVLGFQISSDLLNNLMEGREEYVLVILKDSSGISYSDALTSEDILSVYQKRKSINLNLQGEIINGLEDAGVSISSKSGTGEWFTLNLDKEGLDKLGGEEKIEAIYSIISAPKDVLINWPTLNLDYQKQCVEASDCILIKTDCCWSNVDTINKRFEDFNSEKMKKFCLRTACTMGIRFINSTTDCIGEKCVLVSIND